MLYNRLILIPDCFSDADENLIGLHTLYDEVRSSQFILLGKLKVKVEATIKKVCIEFQQIYPHLFLARTSRTFNNEQQSSFESNGKFAGQIVLLCLLGFNTE
jgi:hypothetical protein